MKLFVVSSRYGVELEKPAVFMTENEAKTCVADSILACIIDNCLSELEDDKVDVKDTNAVIGWAEDHDYVSSYNTDIYDTFTYSDDWTEYRIDEVEVR